MMNGTEWNECNPNPAGRYGQIGQSYILPRRALYSQKWSQISLSVSRNIIAGIHKERRIVALYFIVDHYIKDLNSDVRLSIPTRQRLTLCNNLMVCANMLPYGQDLWVWVPPYPDIIQIVIQKKSCSSTLCKAYCFSYRSQLEKRGGGDDRN